MSNPDGIRDQVGFLTRLGLQGCRGGGCLLSLLAATSLAHGGTGPGGSEVTELVGEPLQQFPYFEYHRAFNEQPTPDAKLDFAIDPTRFPAIQGATCDVFVVEARSRESWDDLVADPQHDLNDLEVRPGGSHVMCGPAQPSTDIRDYSCKVSESHELSSDAEPCVLDEGQSVCVGLGHRYDLVLDCDQDGQLGPGDFLDGGTDEAGFYVVHDTVQERLSTVCLDYDASGLPSPFNAEPFWAQRVYAPKEWLEIAQCPPGGGACSAPLPLVAISHGVGHHYDGYDYLQQHLASYGYVVMSHVNKAEGTITELSSGTLEHTNGLLDILNDANCQSRIDNPSSCGGSGFTATELCAMKDAIDPDRIIWIGHSRGGSGVVHAYDRLAGLTEPRDHYTSPYFDHDSIALLSAMAPLDHPVSPTPDVKPFHLIWTGADADIAGMPSVSNRSNLAFQMLDRAQGHRQSVYIHGGAHGWFHEDCPYPDPPNESDQDCMPIQSDPDSPGEDDVQAIVRGYYVPLFAAYARDTVPAHDYLWRPWERFRPPSAPDVPVALEHKLGVDEERFVLDDYELNHDTAASSSGLSVTASAGFVEILEGLFEDTDCHYDWVRSDAATQKPFPVCTEFEESCKDPSQCPCSGGQGFYEPDMNSLTPCGFKVSFCPDPKGDGSYFDAMQPMNGMTRSRGPGSESWGAVIEWPASETSSSYVFEVPPQAASPSEDLFLSFRAAQMPRHPATLAATGDLDFAITLKDGQGHTSSITLGAYDAGIIEPFERRGPGLERLHMPVLTVLNCLCLSSLGEPILCCQSVDPLSPCNPNLSDPGWQAEFETVRIRLTDFLNNGSDLDLGDLDEVRFEFGSDHGAAEGRIAIDDVEITSDRIVLTDPGPCPVVTPCNGQSCLQAGATSSVDTGLNRCRPSAGPVIECGAQTVHVVTYSCDKAPCCTTEPFCVCPVGDCPSGDYLECQ